MRKEQRVEICVIGGGIFGLSAAYHVAKAGNEVLVVERGGIGREASGAHAGSVALQNKPLKMLPFMMQALKKWEGLSEELGFDVGYERRGGFRIASGEEDVIALETLLPEQRAAGVPLEFLEGQTLRKEAPYLKDIVVAANYCHLDGLANPFKTVFAYAKAIERYGGKIIRHTPVTHISSEGHDVLIHTPNKTIIAKKVINAAGVWAGSVALMMGVSLPIAGTALMCSITETGRKVFPHMVTHAMGNLTLKQIDGRILIGGAWRGDGDPYTGKKKVNLSNFKGSISWACEAIPEMQRFKILRSWIGFSAQTPDRLFLMGQLPPYNGRFYVMAGGASGFSLAPVTGKIMAEWVLSDSVPDNAGLFDTKRFFKNSMESL